MADSVPQQAHHIIPVAVFNGLQDEFEKIFGEDYGTSFQQMGGNFIYLNTTADGAAKTQNLLTSTPDLFGDVSVGGAQHLGSHGGYDAVVTRRLEEIFKGGYEPDQKQMMVLDLQRGLKEILVDGTPNVMQATQFDAANMEAALNSKGVYSPDNINSTTKATQLLDDFNADNGNFLTRTFGTSGTDGIAKYTGEMIHDNMNHLDEITGFLSDGSRTSFDNYVPADAGSARQIIYRSTYDVEKYLSAANITPNLKSASLDSFYAEFKEAVSLSMSDGANSARLTQLTNSLETRALDAKAAKLLSDLTRASSVNVTNKDVHLDLNDFESVNAKNSALWDVLNHIGESSQFDHISINGQLVSDYKKVNIDVDGKVYKPFTEAVFYDAVLKTEIVKAKNGGEFDKGLFKNLDLSTVNIEAEIEIIGDKLDNAIDKFQDNVRFVDTTLFGRALKQLPLVGLLLGASMTAHAAEGKSEVEQKDIWAEFAAGEAASEVAGIAAGIVTGAALVAVGIATGPVAIVAGLAVGIAAGIYGDQAGRDLYQLTKDLDGDGKADIFDEIGTLLFGKNIDKAQIPELLKANTSLINANITDEQLATLAKDDLAYRYALLKLNPFVITDIDYSQFNQNGELELYSPENPDGMTDEYIEKRAEMLEAKIQELTTGTSNGEHSYRDIATEQDILSPYTDYGSGGNGIRNYRSEVIFADDDGQTITSLDYGNTNDFLFGGKGSDTLEAGEGNDYLEGNKGTDTLIGGDGDDTLFGGTGNDTLHGDSENENDGKFGFFETKGNDVLIGGTGGDTIYGGRGKDTIILAEGNKDDSKAVLEEKSKIDTEHNVAFGGEGNDTIYGSDGKDNIITGTQEDEDSDENTINYGYGFGGDDALIGRAGVDYLYGGDDKDTIWGGKGNDVLEGGAGVDTLYGEDGHDVLVGNAGDDSLYGGAGSDLLMGDTGYDTYNYNNEENKGQKSYIDQIYDIDGKGQIVIDGKKLAIGERISSNTWLSEDENYYITRYQKSVLSSDWLEGSNDIFKSMYNPNESRPYLLNIGSAKHYQSVHKVWFWKDGDLDLKLTEKEPEPKPDPIPPPPPPPPPPRDPLSLDLDNDGVISTLSLANGVYFDLDNSGFAEKTAWIGQKDGLLVLDKNDNQRIDGGAELFGTETFLQDGTLAENGYLALGEYDTNGDGQITQADATYSKLKVWQDKNSNGVAESDELKTLSELNIESINTDYALNTTTDNNGVEHREDSVFTYIDGKSGITNTLWFDSNRVDSINVDIHHGSQIELDQHIQELPDINGFGNVYSLQQAMQADTTGHLANLVSHFAAESDADIRQELITDIISHWSGQQNIDPSGLGSGINAQTVSIMQGFWGESDTDGVTRAEYVGIELRYEQFSDFVYTQLMKQTHDAFLYSQIEFSKNGEIIIADYTQLTNFIANTLQLVLKDGGEVNLEVYDRIISLVSGINPYDTTNHYLQDFNNTLDQTMQERFDEKEYKLLKSALDKRYVFVGTSDADSIEVSLNTESSNILLRDGNDTAQGGIGLDVIYGESGNDNLSGGAGDDNLIGGIGDDRLNGESGDDILDGGDGNDTMIGGAGNDTYYVDSKDDVITEQTDEGIDTVNSTIDYTLSENIENLILNGSAVIGVGNDEDNIIEGNSQSNFLEGKSGNDILDGGAGIDTMIGGIGDDIYYIDNSEDIIVEEVNEGIDTVISTYDYELADKNLENLTLIDDAITGTGNDLDNILVGNRQNNILNGGKGIDIMIGGNGDDVYYVDDIKDKVIEKADEGVDTIISTDNYDLTNTNVENLILTDNAITGIGNILNNSLKGNDQNNTLEGKSGNDILDGGKGIDIMIGGAGDDTYYIENIEDQVIEEADEGIDTIISTYDYDLKNTNVENLTLTDNAITGIGNDSENILLANSQNNVLDGGKGIDTMVGGVGDDIYYVDDVNDRIVENSNEGTDLVKTTTSYTLSNNIENLEMLEGAINGTGNGLNNRILGNDKDNTLTGKFGDDIYIGGKGNDVIVDNGGNNIITLAKGDGNDTVVLTNQESRAYSTSEYKDGFIWNYNNFAKVSNEIVFSDIQRDEVSFSLSENNSIANNSLIIKYGDSDSITIEDFLENPELTKITYSDGSFDSLEDIYNELTIELLGTDQEDDMAGHDSIKNIIHGQAGDDTITGGKNIDKIYGDEGDDSIIISDNDFAYGGLGNDNLSVNESFKAYLDGGLGYDKYNLGNSIGTRIIDADFSGVINVNSDVTHIGYFENKVWDSGHGNFASIVPGLHNTELVSEIKTGEWTTEYKLKYTADTTRISEFVFDATSNSFVHHKVGTSFKTDFSEYQNGFDYFGFENISNYSDINNLREIDVSISGNTYQYKNSRDTKDYTILSTVISMDDFINQGAVKAVYTDDNDTIEGISNYQSFSFVANNFQDSGVYFPAQNFKNYYENDLEVPEDFGSEKLSGIIAGDIIVAEAGDDKINTGKGSSVVLAGSGNDYIIAPDIEAIDVIYGQSGNDTIYMYDPTGTYSVEKPRKYADNRDIVFGGEGNDSIFFGESDNSVSRVYAGEGDDYIESLGHLGYVEGGEGNDIIKVQGNSNINAGSGDDEITIGSGSVIAGDGDDIITALDGGVTMDGEEGADTLIGGLGDDTFIVDKFDTYFEEGIDLEGGYDTIYIESDFDLSKNNFEAVTLLGNDNFNVLGDQFNNSIIGNDGNNSLNGQAGDDNLLGNEGNDLLIGGKGADTMSGGSGDDYYIVDQYETLINDEDRITLKHGDQVVEGTLSRDGFVQGDSGGNDTVEQWNDHRFYRQDDMGNWSDTGSYHHLQNNIENLILKGDAKTAFGNELDNVIMLNEQNNFVNSLSGDDTIIYQKGGGQDTINVSDSTVATDTLVVQGYSEEQSSFTREQDSLMIRFAGSDEHIWIAGYFKDAVVDTQLNQTDVDLDLLPINDQPLSMIDNKIDRIIFDNNGEQMVLTQQDIDNAIIDRANNHAPTVNKHAQAITINDDEALSVQFDEDTIVDADAWDSILSYRITLASQNVDGSYQDIPDWLSFDADTRTLTGSPTADSIGSYSFILWAGDLFGTSAGTYLTLTVNSSQPVDVPVDTTPHNMVEGTDNSEQLLGTNGNDLINGYAGDDQIFGFNGNDTLNGGAGNDYLAGGNGTGTNSGNDIINGGAGDDTLSGEDGNDILNGGAGNDSYVYKANQGIDIINNAGGGTDVIFFQQIDKTQLTYHKEGNDLIILVDGDLNQQVKVKDHFSGSNQAIDYIVASDGMMVSAQKIAGQLTALPKSDDSNTGVNGNDGTTPTTPTNPDVPTDNVDLSGDNTIKDTKDNDRLEGGRGNDTYIYTAGKDTIIDTHGIDKLIFSNGITFNQVGSGLMSSGNDLILRVNGDANNQVTIKDYFSNGDRIIETISFETGGSISHEQIFGLFGKAIPKSTPIDNTTPNVPNDKAGADIIGTNANDYIQGTEVDNRLQGLLGDDRLDGGLGNDILIGGTGNDLLKGGVGNDLYYFEAGFGQDIIDNTGGGIDNIYFDGIGFNDIASGLMRSNDDLILKVSGTTDQLTIADFFEGGESAVGNISFASGGSISAGQIFSAYGISNPNPTNMSSSQHQSTLGTMLDMMQQFDENSMNNGYGDVI